MEISNTISNRDLKFFKTAQKISQESDFNRGFKIGCVAVLDNKIISKGHNGEKTLPLQMKYVGYYNKCQLKLKRYSAKKHAEIDCLHYIYNQEGIPWNKVKLYIYRECKSKRQGLARPCACCMALIHDLGIKNIYYSTNEGFSHEILL